MTRDIKLLAVTSVSACFELNNELVYHSDVSYIVMLDGVEIGIKSDTNVFSLFDLTPSTQYLVQVLFLDGNILQLKFNTKFESIAININDFHPVADGIALDNKAIQAAINVCPKYGRVVIPKGIYAISPIALKSDITLELKEGVVLLASSYRQDYAILPGTILDSVGDRNSNTLEVSSWQGQSVQAYQSLISTYNCNNTIIVGKGKIDGNTHNSTWYKDSQNQIIAKPRLIFFNMCEDILVHGVELCNSPSWNIHAYFCKNISIYNTTISSLLGIPEADGINPESCEKVSIIGCSIGANYSCISIKSGKIELASKHKTACQNVVIRNCNLRGGIYGISLGSELSAGIYNVLVSQCLLINSQRGLCINTCRGRGNLGIVRGLVAINLIMLDVCTPFVVNSYFNGDKDYGHSDYVQSLNPQAVDNRTPQIGKITISNVVCRGIQHACAFFYGLPEAPIHEIELDTVYFSVSSNAKKGLPAEIDGVKECSRRGIIQLNVNNIVQNNVVFDGVEGHGL
ncbi:MAG: glycoside hydrolase family 28 protein [Firmicutes bacterium]|nr:glycoside hydrolase family 28 protein [Bacillota bacterium]MCL1953904.1 glycoside hydrolase family 28 protein [Bacillota bacterium]